MNGDWRGFSEFANSVSFGWTELLFRSFRKSFAKSKRTELRSEWTWGASLEIPLSFCRSFAGVLFANFCPHFPARESQSKFSQWKFVNCSEINSEINSLWWNVNMRSFWMNFCKLQLNSTNYFQQIISFPNSPRILKVAHLIEWSCSLLGGNCYKTLAIRLQPSYCLKVSKVLQPFCNLKVKANLYLFSVSFLLCVHWTLNQLASTLEPPIASLPLIPNSNK